CVCNGKKIDHPEAIRAPVPQLDTELARAPHGVLVATARGRYKAPLASQGNTMNEAGVRKRLVEALEADLVGPFVPDTHPQGGQEILPLAPSRWYLTGFLAHFAFQVKMVSSSRTRALRAIWPGNGWG